MSIIIMVVFLIGIVLIASFSAKRLKNKIQFKVKYRLIAVYLIALTGITLVYITMIQPNMSNALNQQVQVPYLIDIIYENEDEIGDLPAEYLKEEWDLNPQIEELTIDIGDGQYDQNIWIEIIVDYHDDDKGRVQLYETPTTILGLDISEQVPLHDVTVDGDVITISSNKYIEIKFQAIQNEMTLSQFKHDPNDVKLEHFDYHSGEQALYLELPKNMKVNADEDFFYINYK